MKDYLDAAVTSAIAAAGLPAPETPLSFQRPKTAEHGDLATNVAMTLARPAKKPPRRIAEEIINALVCDPAMIEKVEIAGPGFINFTFAPEYLHGALGCILALGDAYGKAAPAAALSANMEWVSANPTGPLHAGHGRQVCLGATLCTVLEWAGWTVTREYYFNNAGNQMAALGRTLRARYLDRCGRPFDPEDIEYAGDYIAEIAESIYEKYGDSKAESDSDLFRSAGEQWCFSSIKRTLESLGVKHDIFFNEDELYKNGDIDQVLREFRERDLAYDEDGAVWFRATAFGADKDRVIVKASGEPTYRLPDIAYHRNKILRGYDRVIDIFGADHIATIPDVLAGVGALGLPVDHVDVIIHQMVSFVNEGESVRMSKRSGNVYYLDDLIKDVGADAVRYFFVMRGANAHLEFDIKLAQEQSENNPVYYLQYAHARIAGIIRFAEAEGLHADEKPDLSLLSHPAEIALIKTLLEFPDKIVFCSRTYEAHHICTYLNALATEFHKFYHECRVVTSDGALSRARLALCRAAMQVIANGLGLLGISAPERM